MLFKFWKNSKYNTCVQEIFFRFVTVDLMISRKFYVYIRTLVSEMIKRVVTSYMKIRINCANISHYLGHWLTFNERRKRTPIHVFAI